MPGVGVAAAKVKYFKFTTATRQISIRNVGGETLWISFDRAIWYEVSSGTSWDDRANCQGFWYCTQTGHTEFVVNGLQLNLTGDAAVPAPTADELEA
jgi:hypothetical protein